MKYFKFLKRNLYLAIIIISGFAMLGSVLGARKESTEPIEIYGLSKTGYEIPQVKQENAPVLAGVLPLAAEQNLWYNFKYALVSAGAGAVVFCILMAVYMPLYHSRILAAFRRKFYPAEKEDELFIKIS